MTLVDVGQLAVDCIRNAYSFYPDNAAKCQSFVASALRKGGLTVLWEVDVEDRGDGRAGRIDLVAEYNGSRIGIEIDRRSPRGKSIDKLQQFDGYRIICLRGADAPLPQGIDRIVTLPVRR